MLQNEIIETKIKKRLEELSVIYEWVPVDPSFADTAEFCEKYGYQMEESGNTIIVASKRGTPKYAACLVLGIHRLDVNKKVRKLMEVSKLSFANADTTINLTGMMIGGVTPFGLPEDLPMYVDSRVMDTSKLILGGGSRSGKIIINPKELLKNPATQVIEGLSFS